MNTTMLASTRIILFTFVIASLFPMHNAAASNEDLSVLAGWAHWAHARDMLQRRLNSLAFELIEDRRRKIAGLTTAEDWKARQEEVRNTFQRIIGPFPAKTPLNARVLGVMRKDGYRIEKIVFESRPNFYVTSCLFIPDGSKGRRPAILNVIGHTEALPSFW